MGIRCYCPHGHKLNLKSHLAGQRGICPECGVRFMIPGSPPEATQAESEKTPPLPEHATPPQVPPPTAPPIPEAPVVSKPPEPAPATFELDLDSTAPEDASDELPKIVVSDHQKIVTMRTKAKRGARYLATFWLGLVAVILIAILMVLL